MTKINNTKAALKVFEESTIKHADCNDAGNYKEGNKANDRAMKAINYLKKHNELLRLKRFFTHSHIGPRKWAADWLLPICEEESIKLLTEISKGRGDNAFTARIVLERWANPDSGLREFLTKPADN